MLGYVMTLGFGLAPYVPALILSLLRKGFMAIFSVFFFSETIKSLRRSGWSWQRGSTWFSRKPKFDPLPASPAACFFVFLFIFIFFVSAPSQSAQVVLQWDPSSGPVAGYRIYYGTSSRVYDSSLDVGNTTTCTLSNLQDGSSYYFAATAVGTSGEESDYSIEAVYESPSSGCASSLSPVGQSFGSSGGSGSIAISPGSGCTWAAVSNASWVILTSNSSGSGSATLNYSVAPNSSSQVRNATVNVGGRSFTVSQAGASMERGPENSPTPPGTVKRYYSTQQRGK